MNEPVSPKRLSPILKTVRRVGALPWRFRDGEMEIMLTTSRRRQRWILPKGKAKKSEAPWEAAGREALEEAGLYGMVSDTSCGTLITSSSKFTVPNRVLVDIYPMAVERVLDDWEERSFRRRLWLHPNAVSDYTDGDTAMIVQSFHELQMGNDCCPSELTRPVMMPN